MNVLVINCGSSSLKYQLIDLTSETVLAKGLCERIGIDKALPTHTQAIEFVIDSLTNSETGVVKSLDQIQAVGHRIAHGGENFVSSTFLTDEILAEIEACSDLAPLHNPANLIGIRACRDLLPEVPMVGVFDTAFHQTMEPQAYMYGLPYEYYERYKVRRYGFHGTSHKFVAGRAAECLGRDDARIIVCHLGNGSSICAVKAGKSIDTSMGMTPLEGLVMGTRSGDIDPMIMEFIAGKKNLDIKGVMNILNKKSGVEGLSGISSDFRDLGTAAGQGDNRAKVALDVFAYRVAKYIGGYAAAMKGVDGIAFTAGIGENAVDVRAAVCSYLGYLGITLDQHANQVRGEEKVISTAESTVQVMVIPTNEELAIARETAALLA